MRGIKTSESLSADGAGQTIDLSQHVLQSVQIAGTFVANRSVQLSNDDSNWIEHLSGSGPDLKNITLDAAKARVVISGYVSGPVEVTWYRYE
ncbi:MAG: hypothetical protein ACE5FJ_08675, partial [Gemmatimonadales bacterium]